MRDWLKQKFPKLTDGELDRLTLIVEQINMVVGQRKTPENYAQLYGLSQQLRRLLGYKNAVNLSVEMRNMMSRQGHA